MGLQEAEEGIHCEEVVMAPEAAMADRKDHKVLAEGVVTASKVAIPVVGGEVLQWTVLLQLVQG